MMCKIPCTRNNVQEVYREYGLSIYQNLPYLLVLEEHNHAYILIEKSIWDDLTNGLSFQLHTVSSSEDGYV